MTDATVPVPRELIEALREAADSQRQARKVGSSHAADWALTKAARALVDAAERPDEGEFTHCTTPGCDGDARYAAPGRRHIAGCTYPLAPAAPVEAAPSPSTREALPTTPGICANPQCGHSAGHHANYIGGCGLKTNGVLCPCSLFDAGATREPVPTQLTDEERDQIVTEFAESRNPWEFLAMVESILAARLSASTDRAADAWDEGFNSGAHYASADISHATYRTPPPANPYRRNP